MATVTLHGKCFLPNLPHPIKFVNCLTLKRLGYFGGWKDWGGGMMAPPPPWDLGRGSRDRRENLHNGSVRCNLQDRIFRFSKIFLYYFILIMLIYARNQTFCSKSVNKAPKVKTIGLNTLCSILSNCTWKKFRYQNHDYVFYCFVNFLCISLFLLFFHQNLWQTLFEAQSIKN